MHRAQREGPQDAFKGGCSLRPVSGPISTEPLQPLLTDSSCPPSAFHDCKRPPPEGYGVLEGPPTSAEARSADTGANVCFKPWALPRPAGSSLTHGISRKMCSVTPQQPIQFRGGSDDKEPACNAGDPGSIPGSGRCPGEGEGMGALSSILAWRIPWTEEPGGLQSRGLQRVGTTEF